MFNLREKAQNGKVQKGCAMTVSAGFFLLLCYMIYEVQMINGITSIVVVLVIIAIFIACNFIKISMLDVKFYEESVEISNREKEQRNALNDKYNVKIPLRWLL